MLKITWKDIDELKRFDNALKALGDGKTVKQVSVRALNHSGNKAKTQVIRALTKQTGLKRKVIVRAVKFRKANFGSLAYSLKSHGGDVALKFFDAKETRRGVSAKPLGKRVIIQSSFIKGGRFPGRKGLGMGGHVWMRVSGDKFPIEKQKSGVVIPQEMISGDTKEVFQSTVRQALPHRLAHEIRRASGGVLD